MAEQLLPHVNDMDTSELTRGCLIGSQAQEDVFLARCEFVRPLGDIRGIV